MFKCLGVWGLGVWDKNRKRKKQKKNKKNEERDKKEEEEEEEKKKIGSSRTGLSTPGPK